MEIRAVIIVILLCDAALEGQTVQSTAKGDKVIMNAARLRGDIMAVKEGDTVHISCHLSYTNSETIATEKRFAQQSSLNGQKQTLRSTVPEFQFQLHCIFLWKEAKILKQIKDI